MKRLCEDTKVSAERTQAEIQALLKRSGVEKTAFADDGENAYLYFVFRSFHIQMKLKYPDLKEMSRTSTGRLRDSTQASIAREKEIWRRWRVLLLRLKLKFEAILSEPESSSVQEEFLSYIVLPNKTTVGAWIEPQLEQAYQSGMMPRNLPMLADKND